MIVSADNMSVKKDSKQSSTGGHYHDDTGVSKKFDQGTKLPMHRRRGVRLRAKQITRASNK